LPIEKGDPKGKTHHNQIISIEVLIVGDVIYQINYQISFGKNHAISQIQS